MSGALDIAGRAVAAPRIAVIGIGEDGWEGLSETAKRLVREAELLVGGKRHLALVPELGQERVTWPSDIGGFVERLRRGTYLAHIAEHVTLELQARGAST